MKEINHDNLQKFIAESVVNPFYKIRHERLRGAELNKIIKRKNPYLFKAKNIETAGDLAKNILDAFLSSQEETIFGDLMEGLAIYVCSEVFGGAKASEGKYRSVDLIFEREGKIYIVGIKSGPNWGNSDQVNAMERNFKAAKKILRAIHKGKSILAVNGCMYGRDNHPRKVSRSDSKFTYYKLCGQRFWELISGDNDLYKKIIQPLDKEVGKRDENFKNLYTQKVNAMTRQILEIFCAKNEMNWEKLVEFVSKK